VMLMTEFHAITFSSETGHLRVSSLKGSYFRLDLPAVQFVHSLSAVSLVVLE
jgi:hypothetical protein